MVAVVAMVTVAGTSPGWAAPLLLPRPGQVGVGVQGGYGMLLENGTLGTDFGNGPTLGVRLRYRMRYERALGLSFENQRFDIRVPETVDPLGFPGREKINVVLSGLELYQMFGTRTRTTKMIGIGIGLAQTSGRSINGETFYPGDGMYVNAILGVERFVFRSWALDLSARYSMLFLPDDQEHDLQGALGVIFYAGGS
jgi:hypothetical protein